MEEPICSDEGAEVLCRRRTLGQTAPMGVYLEVWRSKGPEALPLLGERITIGKSSSNELVIAGDPTVSRAHAILEPLPAGWSIRDLGSRNGTFVNGERILSERALRPGDEVRIGSTRIVLRGDHGGSTTATVAAVAPPELTRRERDVLIELCRPLLSGDLFTEPASVREIAQRLFVADPTVKQHLGHLYDKFEIPDGADRRRARLANEAIQRGAVSLADLRASTDT